jgi:hemolysin III
MKLHSKTTRSACRMISAIDSFHYLVGTSRRSAIVVIMNAYHPYSPGEEVAHCVTAAIGLAAMLVGIPWLLVTAALHGGAARIFGAAAFGVGALLMFGTSTLYHSARRPGLKGVLRKLDHSAIYILIAGTYTPFTIGVVRGSLGWSLFGMVWSLAVFGVSVKMSGGLRIPVLSTLLYVVIGWIGLVAFKQLSDNLTTAQFAWIVAGGLCYTGGVPFYLWKRQKYAHAVWHLFVLGGVACHFAAIMSVMSA